MPDLKVTLVHADLAWEAIEANLSAFEAKIAALAEPTDLIILPETFTSGFSMNVAALAQTMDGPTVHWLQRMAQEKQVDITGSAIIAENGHFFNRLLWARPNGELLSYDKRHLFSIYGEDKAYTPGTKPLIVELSGWKIAAFICYDLRFPVWSRNFHNLYDLAIYIANWPESRSYHWKSLLVARAIENQAYVVGVNRIGVDGNGIRYSGDSSVIDPWGRVLFRPPLQECVETVTLSMDYLQDYRQKFPAWADADAFDLRP